jgi:predicted amidophosphoribosyltransferase
MIRGDEDKCPRCDLPLEEAQVDCPVCGEKLSIISQSCTNCGAVFVEKPVEEPEALGASKEREEPVKAPKGKAKAPRKPAPPKKATKKTSKAKSKKSR